MDNDGGAKDAAGGGEELQAKIDALTKANEEIKADMFKFKGQKKDLEKKLEETLSRIPDEKSFSEYQEFLEAKRAKEEASLKTVDDVKRLSKKELQAVTEDFQSKLSASQKEKSDLQNQIKKLRIETAIQAAAGGKVVDGAGEQINLLLRDQFSIDENGNLFVPDEDGDPKRIDGRSVTVADVVTSFLEKNAHFLRADALKTGSGSTGSKTQAEEPNESKAILSEIKNGKLDKRDGVHKLVALAGAKK